MAGYITDFDNPDELLTLHIRTQDSGWKIPESPFMHTQNQSIANTANEGTMLKMPSDRKPKK